MNHSIHSADKATHLKVVISALLTGITIMAAALTVRMTQPETNIPVKAARAVYKAHPVSAVTEMARVEKHPI
ncbi:hypothetical protein UNPF46_34895 [Bradyrhizobium sp. UNPF46]|uniref:hypothetical protein n=1 Tax=Bradyrhizobium sp. UNPF46 TaxID=1141168 RepID=UPI00114F1DA6|nr:hypothetical protein [Bradyrhizobium sp. UNPF46]TQF26228.1 hypothetical protein UNPF46_34895 [Bradyrhizobium sp. UNPF46]